MPQCHHAGLLRHAGPPASGTPRALGPRAERLDIGLPLSPSASRTVEAMSATVLAAASTAGQRTSVQLLTMMRARASERSDAYSLHDSMARSKQSSSSEHLVRLDGSSTVPKAKTTSTAANHTSAARPELV